MGYYRTRLDRIEAAIAPQDSFHLVVVKDRQTREDALATYAKARGLKATQLCGPAISIYLTETEARL